MVSVVGRHGVVLAMAGLLLLACGPRYDGRVYDGNGVRFRVGEAASTWRQIDVDGALLAFRDDERDATVAVNARCGKDADDVPLAALTKHLFLMFTDRNTISERVMQMDGRESMRTVITAKLDGVDRGFVVYVLKKDGCVYDFMLITAPGSINREAAAFDSFVAGFHTER